MIDTKTFDTVSQFAHIWFAAFVIVATSHYGYGILGIFGVLMFAGIKEFWYDYHFESESVRGSSLRDFCFYCLGIVFGVLALML